MPKRKDWLLIVLVIVIAAVMFGVSRLMPGTDLSKKTADVTLAPDAIEYVEATPSPEATGMSMLIVPVKESAMLFLFFFGYYPILLPRLNRIRPRIARRTVKFLIFNVSVIIAYFLLINLFGLTEILDSSGLFGQFSLLILWLAGNFLLIVYDNCSAKMYLAYLYWFRPRFLRKFK